MRPGVNDSRSCRCAAARSFGGARPQQRANAGASRLRQPRRRRPQPAFDRRKSENYYDIKSTIFNALIDAIDLTQLGQLDRDAARDEIRDIVNEIITLKDVAMSIAEQEELLEDICNDVLGYGPLEPLLARDDIADIMVNGANTTLHRSRRQDAEDRRALPRQRPAAQHLPAHRQPGRPPRR